jgi:hypothetical protein
VKTLLRALAAALFAGSAAVWLTAGAHRGWTETRVPVKTLDEVTGIIGITYEQRFVPGLDFLAVTVAAAAVLAGASFLFRNQTHQPGKSA